MAAVTPIYVKPASHFHKNASFKANDVGNPRFKKGFIELPETTGNADTCKVDLYKAFNMLKLLCVVGFYHSTKDSVMLQSAPVTAVDGTVLTITADSAGGVAKRVYVVYGL